MSRDKYNNRQPVDVIFMREYRFEDEEEEFEQQQLGKFTPGYGTRFPIVSLGLLFFCYWCYFIQPETAAGDVTLNYWDVFYNHEYSRILISSFYHFTPARIFANTMAIISIGRTLEERVRPLAVVLIYATLMILSNIIYLYFSYLLCPPSTPTFVSNYGLSKVIFGMKLISAYISSEGAPPDSFFVETTILDFMPFYVPYFIAPYQSLLEMYLLENIVIGKCMMGELAGLIAGCLILAADEVFNFIRADYKKQQQ